MKKLTRTLALFLVLIVLSALFASCQTPNEPADTTGETSQTTNNETTNTEETTIPAASDLQIVLNNVANAKVVRDENQVSESVIVECARKIREAIGSVTGVTPGITTDWTKDGTHDSEAVEILVGPTNYIESQAVLREISYGEYMIKVVGNKLVVAAYSDTAISKATNELIALIKQIGEKGSLTISKDTLLTASVDKKLAALPAYDGGTYSATYESGGDGTLIIIKNTNTDEYQKYLKKLAENGYTEYTTTQITDNHFATYTNQSYTISAGYYHYETAARIVIEPLAKPVGLESENKYTKVTTSQITMLGLSEKDATGTFINKNGISILIRLDDGRFIVIDGGFNRANNATALVNTITDQSKGYLKSGDKPTIAAWIITHPHGDHSGMIGGQYGYFRQKINIEKFLVSFISETERQKAINYYTSINSTNWSANEGGGYTNVFTAAKSLGAYVHQLRTGQIFYIANVKLEVLYTIDSFAPNICNALNTTSNVIKMTFSDGTVYMSNGDATGNALQICARMYGTYLKSDIVQVTHHGYGTWGNDAGVIQAYNFMLPETLAWPLGTADYEKNKAKNYNIVLYDKDSGGSNANFKESYVSGELGDYIIFPIPYTVGSAIVYRANKYK